MPSNPLQSFTMLGKLMMHIAVTIDIPLLANLMDWSGRAIHPDKRGKIADHQPKILQRLQIEPTALLSYLSRQEDSFHHVIGSKSSIREAAVKLGKKFLQGIAAADRLFPQRI